MRYLIACEESQAVTIELRKLGVEAYSCDILPCSGGYSEWHLQCDLNEVLREKWDAIIAFPPCTHLAVSGARHFAKKIADGRQQQGVDFFMMIANHDCDFIAIENPVGIMSSKWRKPDQIIQPWQFGHPERKSTCLWLKGFNKLIPTNDVKEAMLKLPKKDQNKVHYMAPGKDRAKNRSKTFPGIATAMANQWANIGDIN